MNQNQKSSSMREFRRLEDLNLIDNFLFRQMLSQEEDGEEFAWMLIVRMFRKKTTQSPQMQS